MSDYKRFISYVYEYRGGQKQENRGFVKVESRNGQCQMDFVLKGLCQDGSGTCQLYAFRRDGRLLKGSLLDTRNVQDGMVNCRLKMPCANIGDQTYSLEETAGLLMLCNQDRIYATQWDDDPLDFQGFPNTAKDLPNAETEPATSPTENSNNLPLPGTPASDTPANNEQPAPETDVTDDNAQPAPAADLPDDDTHTAPTAATPDDDTHAAPTAATPDDDTTPEPTPPTNQAEPADNNEADVQATSASAPPPNYFRDGSIINCVKITLKDLKKLDARDWHLKNNQFVHYGYQAFGHLLVGQMADSGQTVLCVPGTYHQRECFMANMFCFPHFKQCPGRSESRRCFGYWYRSIHPTNLNSGDSCS